MATTVKRSAATSTSRADATTTTNSSENSGLEEDDGPSTSGGESRPRAPKIDVDISNVVCSFSVRCHLNLTDIAIRGINVEHRKAHGMLTMKLRSPYTTASIWSSGKVTCTGARSEEQAKIAARRFARILQKLGFNVKFCKYRVVNVLGTCHLPFAVNINQFAQANRQNARYEPELHPSVVYKLLDPKATLKIFSTGSITITGPSVANVQAAMEHIYPRVAEFKTPKEVAPVASGKPQNFSSQKRKRSQFHDDDDDSEEDSDDDVDVVYDDDSNEDAVDDD